MYSVEAYREIFRKGLNGIYAGKGIYGKGLSKIYEEEDGPLHLGYCLQRPDLLGLGPDLPCLESLISGARNSHLQDCVYCR